MLGPLAGFAAAFIAASPPLLIQAVAGLALLTSLAAAMTTALEKEERTAGGDRDLRHRRLGVSLLGIGAAFWGLVAGGALLLLEQGFRVRRRRG